MSKNFLEINNVSFKAGGKTKVKNVSFKIENKGDVPSVGKTFVHGPWRTVHDVPVLLFNAKSDRGRTVHQDVDDQDLCGRKWQGFGAPGNS